MTPSDCRGEIYYSARSPSLQSHAHIEAEDASLPNNIHVERVTTKRRALDVKVFRKFSISPSEYISLNGASNELISEQEAIDQLMPGYDEKGNYIHHLSPHEREVYFVAVYDDEDDDNHYNLKRAFAPQNGVVGVVSAQIRNLNKKTNHSTKSTHPHDQLLVARSLISFSDISSFQNRTLVEPNITAIIQKPHVYLANMRVDESMQRRGIGSALLSMVTMYAKVSGIDYIVLSVDNDNLGAIQMYGKYGYRYIDKNECFGTMAMWDL